MQGCREDPDRAFESLFEANYTDLYRYAIRRCPTREDAEDLVAETFAVAWRRLAELPAGDAARLWLFGTARLLRMNQLRSTTRRRALLDRLRTVVSRPYRSWGLPIETTPVGQALAALGDADREVLLLVAWEGLTAVEISTVLEITPAAARKRLERARARFREALQNRTTHMPEATLTTEEARP